jgi:hypothetical protein
VTQLNCFFQFAQDNHADCTLGPKNSQPRSVSEGESRSVEGASQHSPSLTLRVTFETESSFLKSGNYFGRVPKRGRKSFGQENSFASQGFYSDCKDGRASFQNRLNDSTRRRLVPRSQRPILDEDRT